MSLAFVLLFSSQQKSWNQFFSFSLEWVEICLGTNYIFLSSLERGKIHDGRSNILNVYLRNIHVYARINSEAKAQTSRGPPPHAFIDPMPSTNENDSLIYLTLPSALT